MGARYRHMVRGICSAFQNSTTNMDHRMIGRVYNILDSEDASIEQKVSVLTTYNKVGWTILHYAACKYNYIILGAANKISPKYLDFNIRTTDGENLTPYLVAAKYISSSSLSWFRYRLKNEDRIDKFAVDSNGQTALHLAVEGGGVSVLEFIEVMSPGCEFIRSANGELPIHIAARLGYTSTLLAFLDRELFRYYLDSYNEEYKTREEKSLEDIQEILTAKVNGKNAAQLAKENNEIEAYEFLQSLTVWVCPTTLKSKDDYYYGLDWRWWYSSYDESQSLQTTIRKKNMDNVEKLTNKDLSKFRCDEDYDYETQELFDFETIKRQLVPEIVAEAEDEFHEGYDYLSSLSVRITPSAYKERDWTDYGSY